MLLHQVAQHLHAAGLGQGAVRFIVGQEHVAHLRGEAGQRVVFIVADDGQQFVQGFDQGVVVFFVRRLAEQGSHIAPVLAGLFDQCGHGYSLHLPLSYPA
ncbi:hypothetical protein D3C84_1047570 [compost metagenome]